MRNRDITIGPRELRAWQVAPGEVWVQSRSPRHTRRLSQRSDNRLVAVGVAGGYLRTYAFPHSLAWARDLIARYTASETPANRPEIVLNAFQSRFVVPGRVRSTARRETGLTGEGEALNPEAGHAH